MTGGINLWPSQVEVLRAVRSLAGNGATSSGSEPGQRPLRVALYLGRDEGSVERSLIRLTETGHLVRNWVGPPISYSTYRLTPRGEQVLDG